MKKWLIRIAVLLGCVVLIGSGLRALVANHTVTPLAFTEFALGFGESIASTVSAR